MSLQLTKTDVYDVKADAIVNFISPKALQNNRFFSSRLFDLAGPGLKQALARWENLFQYEAVITGSYNLSNYRFIIHALGIDSGKIDSAQLASFMSSITKALTIAKDYNFSTLAMSLPEVRTSVQGDSVYSLVTEIIKQFLMTLDDADDMTVYLCIKPGETGVETTSIHKEVEKYIAQNYLEEVAASRKNEEYYKLRAQRVLPETKKKHPISWDESRFRISRPLWDDNCEIKSKNSNASAQQQLTKYNDLDKSFIEMVDWWLEKKNIKMKDFCVHANLNRAMLSNLRCHPDQNPKKTNALACAIGLELNLAETKDLLSRAGFSLSKYLKTDVIVEYFITNEIYDIFTINEELFANDLVLLGTS